MNSTATRQQRFLVFSDDWGVHPSSCQHLFRHISASHEVTWINTVGMRRPRFDAGDVKKAARKLRGMFGGQSAEDSAADTGTVQVLQPLMLPFADINAVRRFNARSARSTIQRAFGESQNEDVTVVTTVPNACDYVDTLTNARIVYYCVDDFSEWPGLNKSLVLEMEALLIEKADVFVATSSNLYERLASTGKPTHLLPHGVDVSLFSSDPATILGALRDIPEPRVCYFGLFDDRSDKKLLASLADRMPDVSFVIAGTCETDISDLQQRRNVFFVGFVHYESLPELIKGVRVLIMPYKNNRLAESLSPLKLKEYLVTGRPVISTPIPAAVELARHVELPNNVDEWQSAIEVALSTDVQERRELLMRELERESWSHKASEFLAYCGA